MDGVNSDQEYWDALSIPFSTQIDAFLLSCPEQSQLKSFPLHQQLHSLSTLLKETRYALAIARLFSPLLVDLCARWLDDEAQDESKFIIFGLLLPAHEELYP
jgi:midasin